MACGRERTGSAECLVHGADVDTRGRWGDSVTSGEEQYHRTRRIELLGLRFIKAMGYRVPAASFEEHAIAETSIFWLFSDLMVLYLIVNLIFELQLINSDLCFTGIVLESSSEESLREEETRDPERWRRTFIKPVL